MNRGVVRRTFGIVDEQLRTDLDRITDRLKTLQVRL
jgi:hypothetical protein